MARTEKDLEEMLWGWGGFQHQRLLELLAEYDGDEAPWRGIRPRPRATAVAPKSINRNPPSC